jgi:hypothetical protein
LAGRGQAVWASSDAPPVPNGNEEVSQMTGTLNTKRLALVAMVSVLAMAGAAPGAALAGGHAHQQPTPPGCGSGC